MRVSARIRGAARRWTLVVAVLASAIGGVVSAPIAAAAPTGLVVSTSPNRTNPETLQGATLKGDVYIFVTGYSDAREVRFSLDGGSSVRRSSPFDFAGTGRRSRPIALDTTSLTDGTHVLAALVLGRRGKLIASIRATFAVANHAVPGKILVPAYFYPGTEWTRMCETLPAGSIAIMNPNSGPGAEFDAAYAAAVDHRKRTGRTIPGLSIGSPRLVVLSL